MQLTWFGHSAVRAENGGHVILIDPFLSQNPKFRGAVDDAARGVTHVVLTHGHDDHVGYAASICKKNGAALVAVFELAMFLAQQGVEKIEPANPGGRIDLGGGAGVSFVKAFHSSSTTVDGKAVYLLAALSSKVLAKHSITWATRKFSATWRWLRSFSPQRSDSSQLAAALLWVRRRGAGLQEIFQV